MCLRHLSSEMPGMEQCKTWEPAMNNFNRAIVHSASHKSNFLLTTEKGTGTNTNPDHTTLEH